MSKRKNQNPPNLLTFLHYAGFEYRDGDGIYTGSTLLMSQQSLTRYLDQGVHSHAMISKLCKQWRCMDTSELSGLLDTPEE